MVRSRSPARRAVVNDEKLAAKVQRQVKQRSEITLYRLRDVAARSDHQVPRQNWKRVEERDEIRAEGYSALFRRQVLRAQEARALFDRRRVNLRPRTDDPLRVELRKDFRASRRKLLVFHALQSRHRVAQHRPRRQLLLGQPSYEAAKIRLGFVRQIRPQLFYVDDSFLPAHYFASSVGQTIVLSALNSC